MGETPAFEVWHGESMVGQLWDVSVDQPWFLCRFVPGAGWSELSPLLAAQEEARRQQFPKHLIGAIAAVRDLDVELRPVAGGEPIRPWMIYLADGRASFRY
ncbi:hypothetical protein ABZ446_41620 [Streptomyces sp. NPDC005813]|uniref:hypothetical protein n=1 Tax=Streptomyces sp. NPDC005813 TaxID=3155592 RepID=UPI0033C630E6